MHTWAHLAFCRRLAITGPSQQSSRLTSLSEAPPTPARKAWSSGSASLRTSTLHCVSSTQSNLTRTRPCSLAPLEVWRLELLAISEVEINPTHAHSHNINAYTAYEQWTCRRLSSWAPPRRRWSRWWTSRDSSTENPKTGLLEPKIPRRPPVLRRPRCHKSPRQTPRTRTRLRRSMREELCFLLRQTIGIRPRCCLCVLVSMPRCMHDFEQFVHLSQLGLRVFNFWAQFAKRACMSCRWMSLYDWNESIVLGHEFRDMYVSTRSYMHVSTKVCACEC